MYCLQQKPRFDLSKPPVLAIFLLVKTLKIQRLFSALSLLVAIPSAHGLLLLLASPSMRQ